MQNSGDNGFKAALGRDFFPLVESFLQASDYATSSRRAISGDLLKFAWWFCRSNAEWFDAGRVTTRDCTDFRDWLRREQNQSVATTNRCLVSIRQFFAFLQRTGRITASPASGVKELRRQELAPKTLDRSQIRKLLRESEARNDFRAAAIFSVFLYCGCRVSELCGLELEDLALSDRSGWLLIRHAKGGKQRRVPVPLHARRALEAYIASRPPLATSRVFLGERGPLTPRGVRSLLTKYSAITGVKVHPHLLRHVFGHEFLAANQNDLVGLASLMGHENLNTTKRYVLRTAAQLEAEVERLNF